jgi:hypothetical protein
MGQYLETIRGIEGTEKLANLIVARTLVNGLQNIVGHILYVDELIQDGATVSVVFIELAVLTAPLATALTWIKNILAVANVALDVWVAMEAHNQAARFPTDSAQYANLIDVRNNFIANAVADGIGVLLTIIDSLTGGFANMEVIKTLFKGGKAGAQTAVAFADAGITFIMQQLTIWIPSEVGPDAEGREDMAPIAQNKAVQKAPDDHRATTEAERAGQVMDEMDIIQEVYAIGEGVVEGIGTGIEEIRENVRNLIMVATDGEDPFTFMKNKMVEGLEQFNEELSHMAQLKEMVEQGKEKNQEAKAGMETAKAYISGLTLPEIPDPAPTDYGDSWLANAAEWVADKAKQAAAATMQYVRDKLQEAIDFAKETVKGAIDEALEMVDSILEWLTGYAEMLDGVIGQIQEKVAEFTAKLAECEGFGDIFGLLTSAISEMISPHEEAIDFEGLSALFSDFGNQIMDAISTLSGYL